jgi:uroporphyrinogen decarboxylase
MTSRERVVKAMRREKPDRVPFDFPNGFAPAVMEVFRKHTGLDDPYDYFGADVRYVGEGGTKYPNDYSEYHPNLPPTAWVDEWGIGHLPTKSTEKGHSHLEGFLYPMLNLRTKEDILNYPLPDVEAEYRYEHLPAQVRALHDKGVCVTGCLACTFYEIAWYMRSMELLLMDFVDNQEFAEILLDRILEKRIVQAKFLVESGIDILQLGDDIASQRGMMMRMSMWRKWFKSRMETVIQTARKVNPDILIFYHSDGDCTEAIPDLIEIGVDILNPVQAECMDGPKLKKLYGERLSFWGTIGTQTTLPFGTPEDVRREVKVRMETMGRGGGLCLGPTHMVEPDVTWENLTAFVDAVKEYGRYS